MHTPPDKACIALTGVQPGFSAECRVLAGTATTPPAVKFWQPAVFPRSLRIMHPTRSPTWHASQGSGNEVCGFDSASAAFVKPQL